MIRVGLSKLLQRIVIIGFWIGLTFLFLTASKVKRFFYIQPEKSISIYSWTEFISPETIDAFQKETGIRVYQSFFETNEELYAKMLFSKGVGYDLIMPSDFIVEQLIAEKLLQKLDKNKLDFWDRIQPNLLGKYYDPGNVYSVPYAPDYYCVGYDKNYFNTPPAVSWDLIFDNKKGPADIGMLNDAREGVLLTARYLFGTIEKLSDHQLKQLAVFLREQKKRVVAYTDLRADYLLGNGTAQVAVSQTSFMIRAGILNSRIGFVTPRKTFMIIDNLVIPAASTKQNLVYQFMNFLMRPAVLMHHFHEYTSLPPTTDSFVKQLLAQYGFSYHDGKDIEFFRSTVPSKIINNIWLNLKAY